MTTFLALQELTAASLADLERLTEAWQTYTVSWTSSGTAPAIGNGTLTGRKLVVGKNRWNYIRFAPGSTITFGTGQYFWSLSDTAARQYPGSMYIFDSGTANRLALAYITSGLATIFGITVSNTEVAATVPQTWANGDEMVALIHYEVA